MLHVRAMFRVLDSGRSHDQREWTKLAPTYSSRDGREAEENRSFSKWTPSGSCELGAPSLAPLFKASGSYLYLDIYEASDAPPVPEDAIRLEWFVNRFEVDNDGEGAFATRMYRRWDRVEVQGTLWMTITNLSEVTLGMFRLEPGKGTKRLVIDYSLVPEPAAVP